MKQSWRQTQADAQLEVHFKLNVPERLTALQALNAAHRATDFTSLLSSEGGPVDLSWRPCPLDPPCSHARRSFIGCKEMDNSGDHVLCCHKLGICARRKETRNEPASLCGGLKLRVDMEKGPDGSLLRPGDVLLQIAGNGGLRSPFAGVAT